MTERYLVWHILAMCQLESDESAKLIPKFEGYVAQEEMAWDVVIGHMGALWHEIVVYSRFWPCANSKVLNQQKQFQSSEAI